MSNIDFSGCKKIAQDKNSATFRHKNGHEIKIAIAGLGPEMRKRLEKLPLHKAEGEEVEAQAAPAQQPEAPLASAPPEQEAQEGAIPHAAPPAEPVAQPAAPVEPEQEESPQETPVMAQNAPQQELPPHVGTSYEDKLNEHMKFAEDLASGQVSPKTYKDLFFKTTDKDGNVTDKSTLGKVGSVFGLLLSGMGAGLTHQPNLLMELMDKQIQRDLESQKTNKENGRNFLSLQYQHNLQQAQAAEHKQHVLSEQVMGQKNAAITGKILKELGAPQDIVDSYEKRAQEIWAPFETKAKMREVVGHHLDEKTANNPQANAVVKNVILPAIVKKNIETLQQGKAAVDIGTKNMKNSPSNKTPNGRRPVINQEAFNNAVFIGKNAPEAPGAIPAHQVPELQTEIKDLQQLRNVQADYDDSFKRLANMRGAGQVPIGSASTLAGGAAGAFLGKVGSVIGATVGHGAGKEVQKMFELERSRQIEALKQRMGKNLGAEEKNDLANSMFPAWNDSPESMEEAYRKGMQHWTSLESTPGLDQYGLKTPAPVYHFKYKKKIDRETPKKDGQKSSGKKDEPKKKSFDWGIERVK